MSEPTTTKPTPPAVHRLLDIEVQEVSLVDRAANRHRFLVVKRSNDMDATAAPTPDATPTPTAADTPAATPVPDPAANPAADTDASPLLDAAVEALAGLTETVEALGELDPADAAPRVAEVAGKLREAADRLQAAAKPSAKPDAPPAADNPLAGLVAQARDVLARLEGAIRTATPATPAATPPKPAASAPAAKAEEPSLEKSLTGLTKSVQALAETVRGQQQRLSRVEKQFGLPNSAATDERPPKAADPVSWPLDLNAPVDRAHTEKSVSFHDPA